jgi:N-acetylglucosaminyldiphosphoundecaprenol N-acetyl-beta-D-mannosaminyltransferase
MFKSFDLGGETLDSYSAAKPARQVFGLSLSSLDVRGVAEHMAAPGSTQGKARLFVTPNIQHISVMRHDEELRRVMETADLLTCDGFPVAKYARLRGCQVAGRVTGREVVDELMHRVELDASHRLFFLVDNEETAVAVLRWAALSAWHVGVKVEIAPPKFGSDDAYCKQLAEQISEFGATLLFLGVGAPRSEIFAARYRDLLPNCWALCIGQSLKISLGLVTPPHPLAVAMKAEWLWRLALEPKRLLRRYADGAIGFAAAVAEDLFARGKTTA